MTQPVANAVDEDIPVWPSTMPDPANMKVVFGAEADELVVRFVPGRKYGFVVDPVADPHDYAALMVDDGTRAVIGVLVYPPLAFAVAQHPGWAALAAEDPPPAAIAGIVADIKAHQEHHGLAPLIDTQSCASPAPRPDRAIGTGLASPTPGVKRSHHDGRTIHWSTDAHRRLPRYPLSLVPDREGEPGGRAPAVGRRAGNGVLETVPP